MVENVSSSGKAKSLGTTEVVTGAVTDFFKNKWHIFSMLLLNLQATGGYNIRVQTTEALNCVTDDIKSINHEIIQLNSLHI